MEFWPRILRRQYISEFILFKNSCTYTLKYPYTLKWKNWTLLFRKENNFRPNTHHSFQGTVKTHSQFKHPNENIRFWPAPESSSAAPSPKLHDHHPGGTRWEEWVHGESEGRGHGTGLSNVQYITSTCYDSDQGLKEAELPKITENNSIIAWNRNEGNV